MHIIVAGLVSLPCDQRDLLEEHQHTRTLQAQVVLLVLEVRKLGNVGQASGVFLRLPPIDLELKGRIVVNRECPLRLISREG